MVEGGRVKEGEEDGSEGMEGVEKGEREGEKEEADAEGEIHQTPQATGHHTNCGHQQQDGRNERGG